MRLRNIIGGVLGGFIGASSVAPVQADTLSRAAIVGMTGSERLTQFTLGRALFQHQGDASLRQAMQGSLQRTGFLHLEPGVALISRNFRWHPILAWDANINGGFINDGFSHAGLTFSVDPTRRALAGMVGGAHGSMEIRLAYDEGRYLNLRGWVEAAYSPEHETGRAQAGVEACARNHVSGFTFADVCASTSHTWRALSQTTSSSLSFGAVHLMSAGQSDHALSLTASRNVQEVGAQNALTLGVDSVWNGFTTGLDVTFAQAIPGQTALRRQVSAQVNWQWQGRAIGMRVWHQQSAGGTMLGIPRQDDVTGVGLSVTATRTMAVDLVHQVTNSTINLFDEQRTGLNFRFDM